MRTARDLLEVVSGQLVVSAAPVGEHDQRIHIGVALDEPEAEVLRHVYAERVLNGAMRFDEQPVAEDDVGLGAREHGGERVAIGVLG